MLTHSGWTNQLEASINNIDQGEASIYLHRQGHWGLVTADHLDLGTELEAHSPALMHGEVC